MRDLFSREVVSDTACGVGAIFARGGWASVIAAMNRYPRPTTVCTKRGCSGSSLSDAANFTNGSIDAVVCIEEDIFSPYFLEDLISADHPPLCID